MQTSERSIGPRFSCLVPTAFKAAVGRRDDSFNNTQQHDSQELVSYVLSWLNEDLKATNAR